MAAEDRYGTAARISALERQTQILGRHVQQLEDVKDRLVREVRSLRAKVAALEDRDRWVESFVANEGRDPFAALGPAVNDEPRSRQP